MMYENGKPYVRWWWFEGEILREDIRYQLDWLKENNFGGVEVQWLGPQCDCKPELAASFLSEEWSALAAYAREYAESIGLGCDFTFGSQWPFGGQFVPKEDQIQNYFGEAFYFLRDPWKSDRDGGPGRIINHMDRNCLERYSKIMGKGLEDALKGETSALFCDSWEIPSPYHWTEGFDVRFKERYGYDLKHLMNYLEYHPHTRYDYRKLLSEYVVNEFYAPFTDECHKLGAVSRVQCHGAPADLLLAYAKADIPETETMLFDPHFTSFAASAAVLESRPKVTCESFTALYGLSRTGPPGLEEEQIADIKLVADAMFAYGVNEVIWHGMPFNGPDTANRFGATTYVGPDAAFAGQLAEFNEYMTQVSLAMSEGKPYADIAVYLPLEDNWMRHMLPFDEMRPSAHYHWELQYQRFPGSLTGFQPTWVSMNFLKDCSVREGRLVYKANEFLLLYIDVEWLDSEAMDELLRLAADGLNICIRREPLQPGYMNTHTYNGHFTKLLSCPTVTTEMPEVKPLVEGDPVPEFRCRDLGDELVFFFANPKSKELAYPVAFGQSRCDETVSVEVKVNALGREIPLSLVFEPYQSLLVRVSRDGEVSMPECRFLPAEPRVNGAFPRDHRYPGYSVKESLA